MTMAMGSATTGRSVSSAYDGLRERLERSRDARQQQLGQLASADPHAALDVVAVAHRASVHRMLSDIEAALQRIDDGTYGTCTQCNRAIAAERLELVPHASSCVRCVESSVERMG
jgi:RNA polymerase-binding transcription factor DksA